MTNEQGKKIAILTTTSLKNNTISFKFRNGVLNFNDFMQYNLYIMDKYGVCINNDEVL